MLEILDIFGAHSRSYVLGKNEGEGSTLTMSYIKAKEDSNSRGNLELEKIDENFNVNATKDTENNLPPNLPSGKVNKDQI